MICEKLVKCKNITGLGFLCKCKGTFTALSLMSLPVWHLSIVIDGCASSDRSPGPMLVWIRLGLFCVLSSYVFITSCVHVMHDVCIVLGSSLVFLVFCYMLIGRKGLSYLFYHNSYQLSCDLSPVHVFNFTLNLSRKLRWLWIHIPTGSTA